MNDTPVPAYRNPFAQLWDALMSPAKAFAALKDRPRWFLFFLICILTITAMTALNLGAILAESQRIMQQMMQEYIAGGSITPEMAAEQQNQALGYMPIAILAGPAVNFLLYILTAAFALHIGAAVMGRTLGFKRGLSIASLAMVAQVVAAVLFAALIMLKGDVHVGADLGLLFPRVPVEWYTRLAKAFCTRLDLFAAWTCYLYVVGLREVTGMTTAKAGRVVLILWLIWAAAMTAYGYFFPTP